MATTAYEHDADGSKFIPATQRPDGTWRKPRRVRDGYVPQEEVPLYESKGKQFAARQNTGLPVGFTPEIVTVSGKQRKSNNDTKHSLSGLVINVEKKKKKKKSGVDNVAEKLAKCEIIEPTFSSPPPQPSSNSATAQADPAKRLKTLRKKLRETEILEEKVRTGVLKILDNEQKEKISKKNDILNEIDILEKTSE